MPIVPFSRAAPEGVRQKGGDLLTPPPMDWALIAAAQMHSEGRLVEPPIDIKSDIQKEQQGSYQPTDPKNMRRELESKGTWTGNLNVPTVAKGLY